MTSPRATDPIRERLAEINNTANSGAPDFMLTVGTNYRLMRQAITAVLDKLDDIDLVIRLNDLGHSGKALSVAVGDLRFVIADTLGVGVLPVEDNQ